MKHLGGARYWVKWNTLGDSGFMLVTATNLNGPWYSPEYYNNYADGTNPVATQILQGGQRWNLMMPYYYTRCWAVVGGGASTRWII